MNSRLSKKLFFVNLVFMIVGGMISFLLPEFYLVVIGLIGSGLTMFYEANRPSKKNSLRSMIWYGVCSVILISNVLLLVDCGFSNILSECEPAYLGGKVALVAYIGSFFVGALVPIRQIGLILNSKGDLLE